MIRTAGDALALLRERRVLMLTPLGALPSLVAEVAGGPIAGSWWSHPEGKRIFGIASALEDAPEVLAGKLIEGKVAFVHATLWPALLRLATDPDARRAALEGLSKAARKLASLVEQRGEVRMDQLSASEVGARDAKALGALRGPLEKRLLVLGASVHTGSGSHAAVLRSWEAFSAQAADAHPGLRKAAARLDASAARAALRPYWTLAGSSADAM
ncbi:MAG: hypothetical protein NVS4B10_04300 [Myxococcales bacterium]